MAIMNWTSQRAAQLQIEQDKQHKDTFTATLRKVASTVTSSGIHEGDPPLLTALSLLFEEIQFQKRRTGTIKPQQFISTLKRENCTSLLATSWSSLNGQLFPPFFCP